MTTEEPRVSDRYGLASPRARWGTCCPSDPECEHSFLDDYALTRWLDTPINDVEAARISGELQEAEAGTIDQWWPASGENDPPVNMIILGVGHHHATGHLCGGGGYSFDCEQCDFVIQDGIVEHGGWVRFKADAPTHNAAVQA